MKKIYLFAVTALALASCSSDTFLGKDQAVMNQDDRSNAIEFGSGFNAVTRAGEFTGSVAAEKLGGKFTVYGYKGTYDLPAANKEVAFNKYQVFYEEGTAGSTATNTKDWEYVGGDQIIKYWDYSAPYYNFLAWSISDNSSATLKDVVTTDATADNGDKVTFNVPSAKDAKGVYIANRYTATPDGNAVASTGKYDIAKVDNKYQETVTLTFRNIGAKVRLGIYETVPGYQVNDVVFYEEGTNAGYTQNTRVMTESTGDYQRSRTANTYKNGDYKQGVDTYGECSAVLFAKSGVNPFTLSGDLAVTYNKADNVAEIAVENTSAASSFAFGTLSRSTVLGTTSKEATFWSDGYIDVLPMAGQDLYLKVDYTLTALDDSHESIRVQGATAVVPASVAEWKSNYAYTYIFKISDKSNGYTGGDTAGQPDDPEQNNPADPDATNNPAGLFPITFDACVTDVQTGNQETITTISEPSITTYQFGSKVTENDEYVAKSDKGNIYVGVMIPATAGAELATLTANTNAWLYTAYNLGSEDITEAAVANKNSKIALTDVTADMLKAVGTGDVPTVDGYTFDGTGKFLKFNPVAGTTYVFKYKDAAGKFAYKVIKVQGNQTEVAAAEPTYTMAAVSATNINEPTTVSIKNGNNNVVNCPAGFVITDANNKDVTTQFVVEEGTQAGSYKVTPVRCTSDADYTITFKNASQTFHVNAVSISAIATTIIATNSTTITLENGNSTAITDAKLTLDRREGVTITNNNDGTYTFTTDNKAKNAYVVSYLGQSVTINVNNYSLKFNDLYVNKGNETVLRVYCNDVANTGSVQLALANATAATKDINTSSTKVRAAGASGQLLKATLGNATATITIKDFQIANFNPAGTAIDGTLGNDEVFVQLTENGEAYTALTSSFTLTGATITSTSVKGVYRVKKTDTTGSVTYKYQDINMCTWSY